eukprot:6375244-Prymnesium_polylepis.1
MPAHRDVLNPPPPCRSRSASDAAAEGAESGGPGQEDQEEGRTSHRVHQGAEALVLGPPSPVHEDGCSAADKADKEEGVVNRHQDSAADL